MTKKVIPRCSSMSLSRHSCSWSPSKRIVHRWRRTHRTCSHFIHPNEHWWNEHWYFCHKHSSHSIILSYSNMANDLPCVVHKLKVFDILLMHLQCSLGLPAFAIINLKSNNCSKSLSSLCGPFWRATTCTSLVCWNKDKYLCTACPLWETQYLSYLFKAVRTATGHYGLDRSTFYPKVGAYDSLIKYSSYSWGSPVTGVDSTNHVHETRSVCTHPSAPGPYYV